MKNKVEIEKFCAFCEYATVAPDDGSGNEYMLCSKKGLVRADSKCMRFKYDLLKRQPRRNADLPKIERIDIDDL
ncbi:MAG: hypothetical protein MJ236_03345 [Clostridia bacterium]|nr:hypothetical protein [Clostridia bacterium]